MLGDVLAYQRQTVPWRAIRGRTQAANGTSLVDLRFMLCLSDGAFVLWV